MDRGQVALALSPACLALDVSAQRYAGASSSSESATGTFVRDHLWLITYVGFPGLSSASARIPFSHPRVRPDAAGTVAIEDVVYQVVRGSLTHEDDPGGNPALSRDLVWGLIASVVFAPVNARESIPDNYWISVADFKMFISDVWGRIDIPKRVIKFYTGVTIP
jgi:hypothetical protein